MKNILEEICINVSKQIDIVNATEAILRYYEAEIYRESGDVIRQEQCISEIRNRYKMIVNPEAKAYLRFIAGSYLQTKKQQITKKL